MSLNNFPIRKLRFARIKRCSFSGWYGVFIGEGAKSSLTIHIGAGDREGKCLLFAKGSRGSYCCQLAARSPSTADHGWQFSLRLKTLVDKKRVIQSRSVTNSKTSANFVALFEGFHQFDGDLNKLQVSVACRL